MAQQIDETDQVAQNDDNAPPAVIVLGDAVTLTRGGQGKSIEDKRYQYG